MSFFIRDMEQMKQNNGGAECMSPNFPCLFIIMVKERMSRKKNEVIYEWGKSLIDFQAEEGYK
jgi:hypothetical protein